ncbi:hypothetical protein BD413DRAFT_614564 [Trametes elegans]|nr:hypothetical protein BD413DRAFT_614564 [Trametes elegans]
MVNVFGPFQDYYQTRLLPETSAFSILFIGPLQTFCFYFMAPFVWRIFDAALGGVLFSTILGRLSPKLVFDWAWRSAVDLRAFRDLRYSLAALGTSLILFVFFLLYTYIQICAGFCRVPPHI